MQTPQIVPNPGDFLISRHHLRWEEYLPWVLAMAAFFVFPDFLQLGSQILIMILFAVSLDMILGYAGIISLGHAAFFGTGAYVAGMLSAHMGWNEPISGLVVAALAAGLVGLITGWFILRTRDLTLLMLTMALTILLQEFANEQEDLTGGDDGLQGVEIDPILGMFEFDLYGQAAYLYSLAVLFVMFWVVRAVIYSPFGQSLRGIRENTLRSQAVGVPVPKELLKVYTLSAAVAGVAGALLAQTTEFVALETLSFERSGEARAATSGPGLYASSRFYPARGSFHLFNTCNTWTARALAAAGFAVEASGTTRAEGVMSQIRPLARRR